MALTDETGGGMVMPVAPMYGNGGGGGFGNGFGGDGWWIILLFILLGGWGNYGNNGGGFGGGGSMNGLYPWLNQSNQFNEGFQNMMLNDNVTSIRDGIFGISTQLCNGFAGVNQGIANGFAQAEIAANARQMADMNQNFALQSALQNCCCENRAAVADLKYTVATENCADRTAALNNTRDIIEAQTRGTQAILDKLCALELDGVKGQLAAAQRENVGLQNQLNMANLAASQTAQTVNIRDSIIDELRSCPIPAQPVYGSQPIFTCPNNNNGCGCGCGG